MRKFLLVLWFFPLLAFCAAGLAELRSKSGPSGKVRNLIPVLLGIVAFGVSIHPGRLLPIDATSSITLSRVMTFVSAAIACSGVFITYSRRSTAVWVASGGLVLMLIWMFNIIHT